MFFVKNCLFFYSVLFHFTYGVVNCKLPKINITGKSNKETISNERVKLKLPNSKIFSERRSSYLKTDPYNNRDIYDYSPGFDSFYNNINNYPQSSVSYYPFSLQNIDYLYPKIFNRFYPYTSDVMQKSFQPSLDFSVQDNQIPSHRDAQYYEPDSEFQIIKRLVPIGYSTHVVSPREAISAANEINIDPNADQNQIPIVPYMNFMPIRAAAYDNIDVLLKAMENAVNESSNSTISPETSSSIKQKVETIARLMLLVPSFADDIYRCISESKAAHKFIQTAQDLGSRSVEVIN